MLDDPVTHYDRSAAPVLRRSSHRPTSSTARLANAPACVLGPASCLFVSLHRTSFLRTLFAVLRSTNDVPLARYVTHREMRQIVEKSICATKSTMGHVTARHCATLRHASLHLASCSEEVGAFGTLVSVGALACDCIIYDTPECIRYTAWS